MGECARAKKKLDKVGELNNTEWGTNASLENLL